MGFLHMVWMRPPTCSASLDALLVAVLFGLLLGWTWKPAGIAVLFLRIKNRWGRIIRWTLEACSARLSNIAPPVLRVLKDGWHHAWMRLGSRLAQHSAPNQSQTCVLQEDSIIPYSEQLPHGEETAHVPKKCEVEQSSTHVSYLPQAVINEGDFKELQCKLLCQDGGPPWELMMQRSTLGLSYQAWRRDPQDGPTEYKSRTVFEDVPAELVKDFYWDDEFRSEWDDMLIYSKPLEVCTQTGAEIAHWIRQFPLFCSDREYLIGRRIFVCGDTYFCITKSVPYPAIPRRKKPRRVDVYYSSWCVRAVESIKTGRLTACEVMFFHSEDMGIPKEVAKFGIKQGMWGCVKKMDPGIRKYQVVRKSSKPLSHNARMAQIVTVMPGSFPTTDNLSEAPHFRCEEEQHGNDWKWPVVFGAIVLACVLDRGIVGKSMVFGVAKQLGKFTRAL